MSVHQFVTKQEVVEVWPRLQWRHHGAGLLQAYWPDTEDTIRVHIWHESLLKTGIEDSGSKHDHRFELRSQVIVGELINQNLYPEPDDDGDHELWRIEGASDRAKAKMIKMSRVKLIEAPPVRMMAGHTYGLLKNAFHHARPAEGKMAVTVVSMRNKSGWATLVAPVDKPPVHAFDEQERVLDDHKEKLVAEAYRMLIAEE